MKSSISCWKRSAPGEKQSVFPGTTTRRSLSRQCCCSGACSTAEEPTARVKVLGSGCARCNQLEASAVEALKQLGMDPAIEHVRDFAQIAAYGVMSTPALVVDGQVVSSGKVLKTEEVVEILKKVR